ncbi:hypothetical protein F0L68_24895 [Solihabitans fulvus]|uniref:ARG and Rhodanese-Phosphatase-superfamily-associated domain-containing protein n=1 Tax=Solihabitans fulvus TaxID=1892852 RepID=A0A5B2X2Y4_9PSEU|nr:hypothetical protein [Solihabitans fulvus]KAA2257539.1 hypothetical protein F0L68_24895 [Solihabitans fulvus]
MTAADLGGFTGLTGLTAGPAQAWGAVRLVPLLRAEPITDLRLHARLHPNELSVVDVSGATYTALVPHSFVADWTSDGKPAAAYGTQLVPPGRGAGCPDCVNLRFRRRMARREDRNRLRFLPLHLALEGYLALHFGGPGIAWEEWSAKAVAHGLSPREETVYAGADLAGLDDALRVFEIHPDQCGMVLYAADALAAAFVVPHPDDYRLLHPTLLLDMYSELLYQYTQLYPAVPDFRVRVDDTRITDVAGLRAELAEAAQEWRSFHHLMADGLLDAQGLRTREVYRMGRFTLSRFLPSFDPDVENHIGETVTDESGVLAYLKTFRLSTAQVRRGHLLSTLAEHDWHLDASAAALGTTRDELVRRLDRAGFGHLLREDIIAANRARHRRR